jgi:hypothetical protein
MKRTQRKIQNGVTQDSPNQTQELRIIDEA